MNAPQGSALAGRSVLVTGHTGFKGSWLAIWLHRLGAKVSGYALPPPTEPSNFVACGVGDLLARTTRATSATSIGWRRRWRSPRRR